MSFHPGQRVLCTRGQDRSPYTRGGWAPRTNGVYVVRGVYVGRSHDQLYLEEYVHHENHPDGAEIGWNADRFRPLDESRLDVFRVHLVTPPKQKVKALAP